MTDTASPPTRIWALGDPHLSFAKPKPMDIFGPQWRDHPEKIRKNTQRLVEPGDLLLIPGDISWAMKRADAEKDLAFLAELPGDKVLIKGNHDYWWDSDKPLNYPLLHDTPYIACNGQVGIAGTRGWDQLPEHSTPSERQAHQKHVNREVRRLEARLQAVASCSRIFAMIHYPPLPDFAPLLKHYNVEAVLYGHVHLSGNDSTLPENWLGIKCICVAADRISFLPKLIATIENRPASL